MDMFLLAIGVLLAVATTHGYEPGEACCTPLQWQGKYKIYKLNADYFSGKQVLNYVIMDLWDLEHHKGYFYTDNLYADDVSTQFGIWIFEGQKTLYFYDYKSAVCSTYKYTEKLGSVCLGSQTNYTYVTSVFFGAQEADIWQSVDKGVDPPLLHNTFVTSDTCLPLFREVLNQYERTYTEMVLWYDVQSNADNFPPLPQDCGKNVSHKAVRDIQSEHYYLLEEALRPVASFGFVVPE